MADNKKPKTIEELAQWYSDRGLPPYETTRFFIGIDCREAKAFGIYRDEESGEIIVYKNKASGDRAVRYRGNDEAFAVNEILSKLKEEIASRKPGTFSERASSENGAEQEKGPAAVSVLKSAASAAGSAGSAVGHFIFESLKVSLIYIFGSILMFFVLGVILIIFDEEPKKGYYSYNDSVYYKTDSDYCYENQRWFRYDDISDEWQYPEYLDHMASDLQTKKKAKKHYLGSSWKDSFACPDFSASDYGRDMEVSLFTGNGYYSSGEKAYYHIESKYSENWYIADGDDWKQEKFTSLPYEIMHRSISGEYRISKNAALEKGIPDFSESLAYRDSQAGTVLKNGYYRYDDVTYYHDGSEYDSYWYCYNDDEWTEADFESLPEDLRHTSYSEMYSFSPDLAAENGLLSFTETEYYEANHPPVVYNSNDSSDDDDSSWWDWLGGDSDWDYDDSDWDSDW